MLTQHRLMELIHYNCVTGEFTWLPRKATDFRNKRYSAVWNGKYAGTVAGASGNSEYIYIAIGKVKVLAHRLAWLYMTGVMPANEVDHIDGVRSNNSWVNLRAASHRQNHFNRGRSSHNTSGYKGVTFDKTKRKWTAQIVVHPNHYFLGYFSTPKAAHAAYVAAARHYFGAFANAG